MCSDPLYFMEKKVKKWANMHFMIKNEERGLQDEYV